MVILTFMGLVLFAKYGETNPVPCLINKPDQLVPYLVMDVLGNMYGIPGLYVACIFSASLSTVSSGINSLALVFIQDFCKPIYKYYKQRDIAEKRATLYAKVIAMYFGLLTILLAFIYQYLGSLIIQMGLSVTGIVGGPLLSMFVLGLFFPCVNSLSVVVGIIISTILTLWLGIGSMLNANGPPPAVCDVNVTSNFTEFITTTVSYNTTFQTNSEKTDLEMFYSISYLLYGTFAVLVSLIIAIIVSCATGGTQNNPVESRLLSPLYHRIASLSMTYQIPATKDCLEKRTESIETICNGELNEKHVNGYDNRVVIENGTTV